MRVRLDGGAGEVEHVLELLLGERRQACGLGLDVQRDEKADVDRTELERELALGDRRDDLLGISTGRQECVL
jgi:hypothetical protein